MKSNISFIVFLSFLLFGCSSQNSVQPTPDTTKYNLNRPPLDDTVERFVKTLIKDLVQRDLSYIDSKYINRDFGFYNVTKEDGKLSFTHQNEIHDVIDSDFEISQIIKDLDKDVVNYALIQQDLKFNCSYDNDAYYGWNGEGLYITDKTDVSLMKLMGLSDNFTQKDVKKAHFIYDAGYKVILTPKLVFYINKIDGGWYITFFDRKITNCSIK